MDLISAISSISKLAIVAFGITFAFVAYEIFVIMREKRNEMKDEKDVSVPEFNQTESAGHNFTDLPQAQVSQAPVGITHRISKNYLILVGGLIILIAAIFGIFVYQKSQVKPVDVALEEISPIGDDQIESSVTPADSINLPPQDATQSGTVTETPTPTLISTTPIPTLPEDEVVQEDAEDPEEEEKGGIEIVTITTTPTLSVTVSATLTETTEASPSSSLPQAGEFQISLLVAVVALAVIYLALIL